MQKVTGDERFMKTCKIMSDYIKKIPEHTDVMWIVMEVSPHWKNPAKPVTEIQTAKCLIKGINLIQRSIVWLN